MVPQTFSELITAARYGGTTTYQAVAGIIGLPLTGNYMGKEVGQILGEISEDELNQGRPMLSAVVVGVSGLPGSGFFELARGLGKLKIDSNADEHRFWEEEKATVHAEWRRVFKT